MWTCPEITRRVWHEHSHCNVNIGLWSITRVRACVTASKYSFKIISTRLTGFIDTVFTTFSASVVIGRRDRAAVLLSRVSFVLEMGWNSSTSNECNLESCYRRRISCIHSCPQQRCETVVRLSSRPTVDWLHVRLLTALSRRADDCIKITSGRTMCACRVTESRRTGNTMLYASQRSWTLNYWPEMVPRRRECRDVFLLVIPIHLYFVFHLIFFLLRFILHKVTLHYIKLLAGICQFIVTLAIVLLFACTSAICNKILLTYLLTYLLLLQ